MPVLKQGSPTYDAEVIVVDDSSTDRTAEIARAHGARVIPVQLRHIAAVRNAGAAAANGDIFIFVDADTIVNPTVVRAAIDAIQSGVVGGGCTVLWEGDLPLWARVLEKIVLRTMRIARYAAGCFIFVSRPAFVAAEGFDEQLFAAEEIALSQALKRQGRFVILRETVVTSGRKLRLHSFWDLLRMSGAMAVRGVDVLKSRRHLDIWYGERRHED